MKHTLRIILAICVLVPSLASAQPGVDYIIGPQDVLQIAVFDQQDLGGKYSVELDGGFTFPLIGRVSAAGLTTQALEAELKKKLADGYFRNPQVTVSIDTYRSRRVFVTGEVRSPGAYALTADTSLIEALTKAGSTLSSAGDEVVVYRGAMDATDAAKPDGPGERKSLRFNLRDLQSGAANVTNITLQDGDTVYVPPAAQVYVSGQVRSPGAYGIKTDTTVLQAVTLAGGATPGGALNRVKVIHTGDTKENKAEPNDPVQPGDTIIVPEKYF
jgi:polysaccharide export outer membrane protein